MSLLDEVRALEWLEPWGLLSRERALVLEKELRRGLSWRHDLSGRRCLAVAAGDDPDDVAFVVDNASLVIVHVTWNVETTAEHPAVMELSVAEFVEQMRWRREGCMSVRVQNATSGRERWRLGW